MTTSKLIDYPYPTPKETVLKACWRKRERGSEGGGERARERERGRKRERGVGRLTCLRYAGKNTEYVYNSII